MKSLKVAFIFILIYSIAHSESAFAIVDGDEKCSPDGHILVYSKQLNQWNTRSLRKCSSSSYVSSPLVEGDEKCSPEGHVMVFNRQLDKWLSRVLRKC